MNKYLKLKEGDVITFINNNGGFIDKQIITSSVTYSFEYLKEKFRGRIIKIERPIKYETIYEVEEILDEKEREYLSYVIRPFRDRVEYIAKYKSIYDESKLYIVIGLKDEYYMTFPFFKEGTMYKGMELKRGYTLEELGL